MIRKILKVENLILLDELFGTNKKKLLNTIFLVLSFVLGLAIFSIMIAGAEEKNTYREVTVKPGDTLWKISKQNMRQNEDIRCYIYEIRQINNLQTSKIIPGQVIRIPE